MSPTTERLSPMNPTDELDEQLIALLQSDGRMSNREVGRHLGVSDGTIRQRLKRLKEEKIIRLGVVCNPLAVGFEAAAYVRIAAEPSSVRRVADALAAMNEVLFVALTLGSYDVMAFAVTRTRLDLNRLIENKIATLTGVRSIDAREAMGYTKHRYDLVRIK